MSEEKSIIEELYSDAGGFNRERVVKVLKSILTIQRGEHTVFFKKGLELSADDKVIAYALVKKLLKSEGVETTSSVSGKEIKKQTGVKSGTVDSSIKRLKDNDNFLVGSGSTYEIPAHQVEAVLDRLEKYITNKQ